MIDIQVSYMRLLIGDNDRAAPVYSDAQIRSAITLGPTRPALPVELLIAGTVTAVRYPSGPFSP